jgi:capsular polysaccharide biosynthesis protein
MSRGSAGVELWRTAAIRLKYWRMTSGSARAGTDLQRWYWGGAADERLVRVERIVGASSQSASGEEAGEVLVDGHLITARPSARPHARSFATGVGLLAFAPRGMGIRREFVSTFVDNGRAGLGAHPTPRQLGFHLARHAGTAVRALARYELEMTPMTVPLAQLQDLDAQGILASGMFVPTGDGRRAAGVDEAGQFAMEAISTLAILLRMSPESLLRYCEAHGLDKPLDISVEALGLAPEGSRARLLLSTRAVPADEPATPDERTGTRLMTIHRLAGCDRTSDELAVEPGPGSLHRLANATVRHGFLVHQRDTMVVWDDTADPRRKAVAGQHQWAVCGSTSAARALVDVEQAATARLAAGILLAGRADDNWYHFLIDTLPRLRAVEQLPADLPLLVHGCVPRTGLDLLSRLTDRPVISLATDTAYEVAQLWLVVGRSSTVDALDAPDDLDPRFNGRSLRWLRSRIADVVESADVRATGPVLVSRRSGMRSVLGSRTLPRLPGLRELTTFDPAAATLDEQVRVYRTASHLVVPGGAALANMLFVPSSSVVIGLVGDARPRLRLWEALAAELGTTYHQVPLLMVPERKPLLPTHHRSVVLTPRSVVRIRRLLRPADTAVPKVSPEIAIALGSAGDWTAASRAWAVLDASAPSAYHRVMHLEAARLAGLLPQVERDERDTVESVLGCVAPQHAVRALDEVIRRKGGVSSAEIDLIEGAYGQVPRRVRAAIAQVGLDAGDDALPRVGARSVELADIREAPSQALGVLFEGRWQDLPALDVLWSQDPVDARAVHEWVRPCTLIDVPGAVLTGGSDAVQVGDAWYFDAMTYPDARTRDVADDPLVLAVSGLRVAIADQHARAAHPAHAACGLWLAYELTQAWAHFALDCLTRLAVYANASGDWSIPVYLLSDVPPAFVDMASFLFPAARFVTVAVGERVAFDHCLLVPSRVLQPTRPRWTMDGNRNSERESQTLGLVGARMQAALREVGRTAPMFPRRVLLDRTNASYRHSPQEAQVRAAVSAAGYLAIDPGTLPPLEQVNLHVNAQDTVAFFGSQSILGVGMSDAIRCLAIYHDEMREARGIAKAYADCTGVTTQWILGSRPNPVPGYSEESLHQPIQLSRRGLDLLDDWLAAGQSRREVP